MKNPAKRVRIGEILLEQGILSQEQITRALADQKASGKMLGEILVEQNIIPAATLIAALCKELQIQGVVLRHGLIDPALLKLIGEEEAMRLKAIPLQHGLPGTVEVEVDRVSPAALVLRHAGRMLSTPHSAFPQTAQLEVNR